MSSHLLLRIRKQLADVLLGLPDKLVEDLGAVDDFGFPRVEHFANLPRHEGLAGTGRAEQEDTADVLDTELLDEARREHATGKCATEDVAELGIQAADAHVLELEVGCKDSICWCPLNCSATPYV